MGFFHEGPRRVCQYQFLRRMPVELHTVDNEFSEDKSGLGEFSMKGWECTHRCPSPEYSWYVESRDVERGGG